MLELPARMTDMLADANYLKRSSRCGELMGGGVRPYLQGISGRILTGSVAMAAQRCGWDTWEANTLPLSYSRSAGSGIVITTISGVAPLVYQNDVNGLSRIDQNPSPERSMRGKNIKGREFPALNRGS